VLAKVYDRSNLDDLKKSFRNQTSCNVEIIDLIRAFRFTANTHAMYAPLALMKDIMHILTEIIPQFEAFLNQ